MKTTLAQSVSFKTILLIGSLLGIFVSFTTAEAATNVSGTISTNTTWSAASGPYIIEGDMTIASSTTLTVGAGTVIKFSGQNSLKVNGTLKTVGTSGSKVYFTSINDDTVGGDTNGSGPAPMEEDWKSIIFYSGSVGSFDHTTFRYSGYAYFSDAAPAIYNQGGTVIVDNSMITDGFLFAIGQTAGSIKVSNSIISVNGFGIGIKGGKVELIGNAFDSIESGIIDDGNNDLKITNNTFLNNQWPITFHLNKQRSIIGTGNTATSDGYHGVLLRGNVGQNFTLNGYDNFPYVLFDGNGSPQGQGNLIFSDVPLGVPSGSTLNINSGSILKFTPDAALNISGTLNVKGTTTREVIFTSVFDDTVGGDTWTKDTKAARAGDWANVKVLAGGKISVEGSVLRYGGSSVGGNTTLLNQGGTISVMYSTVSNSGGIGISHNGGVTTLRSSNIINHPNYGVLVGSGSVDAINNYWGSGSGPYHPTSNPTGTGVTVSDNVSFKPFLTSPYGNVTGGECCSSVLFLPGIMSTRLYEGNAKRWEPSLLGGDNDVKRLYLDAQGKSVNNITKGDVVDKLVTGAGIYESFLNDLKVKKDSGEISDYSAYGYDWRLSLADILADGSLENKVRELAASSKTGKVTIVAHSNGGLLTKALVNELKKDGDVSKIVDNIVFVGVPQLGTPQAIGALLHGYKSGIPQVLTFVVSEERSRGFAQNAPSAYNLLPHSDYYNNIGSSISTPIVTFADGSATKAFIDKYGYAITNSNELRSFLRGDEGRATPSYNDLISPAKSNDNLFAKSLQEIDPVDSGWQMPAGIKIYQIAGVGELTLAGLNYQTFSLCLDASSSATGWYCKAGKNTFGYSPMRVYDGDETVVAPSALAMPENTNIERWWLNLYKYNDANSQRTHKDLLEISELRSLIFDNILGTSVNQNFTYLSKTKPDLGNLNRMSFVLHSPLSLSYTESDGTVVNEQNPYGKHSRYTRFGEVQLIDVFDNEQGTLNMQGLSKGSFTLELEESRNGKVVASSTFSAIPSITNTKVSMIVDGGSLGDVDDLVVDYNNDKEPDITLEVSTGTVVSLPTKPTPSPLTKDLIQKLKKVIDNKVADKAAKQDLKQRVDKLLDLYNKWEKSTATGKTDFATKIKNEAAELQKQIDKYQKNKKIKRGAAAKMERLLKAIKKSV